MRLSDDDIATAKRHPISMLLYNIRSLYNVGSIFRTADSAGLEALLLAGYTPAPPRKEIDKTALGATSTVPWRYHKEAAALIEEEKKAGKTIIAVELTDESRDYRSLEHSHFPACLILGNEITGIDDDVLALCDIAIQIPMYGVKHSLNVAVTAGIVAYTAVDLYRYHHTNASEEKT